MKHSIIAEVKPLSPASSQFIQARDQDIDQKIYQKIYQAIIEQRLISGTKLSEEPLCATFNVSRTRIRRVLLTLANRNVVELKPNKGAFVATPSPQETSNILEARRSIEGTIVSRVVNRIKSSEIRSIQKIIREETKHLKSGNHHDSIRLSSLFHLRLAEISGNHVLYNFLDELIPRTSLIMGMFGTFNNFACAEGEHAKILEAITSKNSSKALKQMDKHLQAIKNSIQVSKDKKIDVDLQKLFSELYH